MVLPATLCWDLMEPPPHDVDVKALLRIAVVYDVRAACNRATAGFLLSSPLLDQRAPCAATSQQRRAKNEELYRVVAS